MTHTFRVSGMHCASCALLIEGKACGCGAERAEVDLARGILTVEGDFGGQSREAVADRLAEAIAAHGYRIETDAAVGGTATSRWGEFKVAVPVAVAVAGAFVALQRLGLVNVIGGGELSYWGIATVGIVASLSSCLAVAGGLVLSVSASYAKAGHRFWPQVSFHAARLVSFFFLGGAVGSLGSALEVGPGATAALSALAGIAMLALGLNLLDVFPWVRRFQISVPRALSGRALAAGSRAGVWAPTVLGVATFVLPCGFTQSMQFLALSSGGFAAGGLTMLAFALGTLPVLAALSFGASVARASGTFFKVAGLLAIFFAAINLIGAAAAAGIISPILNF